jgi:low temperature requirement protein LtrA
VRASTLELFFDLVFVFTITQLAQVFGQHAGWSALGRVVLMFGVIWWMVSGYVMLTNEVAPIIGIILTAAGIRLSIAHGNRPASCPAALALSGGVALYFMGQCGFRLALGLRRPLARLLAGIAVLATAPIGVVWVAWGQLTVLMVVAFCGVVADDLMALRSGTTSAYTNPAPAAIRVIRRGC